MRKKVVEELEELSALRGDLRDAVGSLYSASVKAESLSEMFSSEGKKSMMASALDIRDLIENLTKVVRRNMDEIYREVYMLRDDLINRLREVL